MEQRIKNEGKKNKKRKKNKEVVVSITFVLL